jgi:hypothetical protein
VQQHVEASEAAEEPTGERLHVIQIGEIGELGDDAARTTVLEEASSGVEPVGVSSHEGDLSPSEAER